MSNINELEAMNNITNIENALYIREKNLSEENRHLNCIYAIEVLNACLNGSSPEVENTVSQHENKSYTKKMGLRSLVSAPCQKYNIKKYVSKVYGIEITEKIKNGKKILAEYDPFNNLFDDIFGYMMADKKVIDEKDYEKLDENKKKMYKKDKKTYTTNSTKKRKSRLQMNALVNVSSYKAPKDEWCTVETTTLPGLYVKEVYSGVMSAIANFHIGHVGKFKISDEPDEFRDYNKEEAEALEVRDLTNEEKFERINYILDGLEFLSISGNQTNYLTDTKPKFVILADYGWGNNVFQGTLKEIPRKDDSPRREYIDIDGIKEALAQNEAYRMSNVYIGLNKFVDNSYNVKSELEKAFKDYDYVFVSDVHTAFNNYKEELKKHILK